MNDNIKKVAEFHTVTSSPILDAPRIPTITRVDLRISLLEEELKEFDKAAYERDLTEVLDALCDLQYVLNGAILEFGLQDVFQEAFDEVHSSNMSKFCVDTATARESALRYVDKNIDAYYKKVGPMFVIMRNSDDKILKGMNFRQPQLAAIIKKHRAKLKGLNEVVADDQV